MSGRRRALPVVLLVACSPSVPQTLADCGALRDATAAEDCRLELVLPHLGDLARMRALIAEVPAPESRDLLRIRLAVRDPVRAGGLCEDAEGGPAKQRCTQVLGRPHLRAPRPE